MTDLVPAILGAGGPGAHLVPVMAGVIGLGISAQWLAWRLRLPSVLVLIVCGLLAGPVSAAISGGKPLLDPDAFGDLLLPFVSLSVGLILFEGGLSLRIAELGRSARDVRNLVTIGAVVTWALAALAAGLLLGLRADVALLFGAILVVSGPTVVVPLLRHIRPSRRVGSVAKWEGIVNDPIGAVLAVLVFDAILGAGVGGAGGAVFAVARSLGLALMIGGVVGAVSAVLMEQLIARHWVPDYLHAPVALALVVVGFSVSNLVQAEAGLISVTLFGVMLGNQKRASVKHILEFQENLRTLLISILFVVLTARLPKEHLGLVLNWQCLVFLLLLVLVIRPAATFASTVRSDLKPREKWFVAWMAPRGIVAAAVSAIFANKLVTNGVIEQSTADALVIYTFLVVIGTVAIYGLTAAPLARGLKLAVARPQGVLLAGAHPWAVQIGKVLREYKYDVLAVDTNWQNISSARMAGLRTFYGSVLSEYALDRMELDGLGRFLAMTPNDETNALAAMHFIDIFGRAECYQLAMGLGENERSEKVNLHQRGRLLFEHGATFTGLRRRFNEGHVVKALTVREEFAWEDFRRHYGTDLLPLFVIRENLDLVVLTADKPPAPKAGQTVIALVREPEVDIESKLESRRAKAKVRETDRKEKAVDPEPPADDGD